jgi:hypothetical protein
MPFILISISCAAALRGFLISASSVIAIFTSLRPLYITSIDNIPIIKTIEKLMIIFLDTVKRISLYLFRYSPESIDA